MASLRDKMSDLLRQVRTNLDDAVGCADVTKKYEDYAEAMEQVKVAERRLKAVRAHVRGHMRKTKQAFQDACPHESKVDVKIRHTSDGARIVEFQACTACSKSFDLREQVAE